MNYPTLIFLLAFLLLWISARLGTTLRRSRPSTKDDDGADFGIVLGATLTLLGLIIGFSFSMAIGRYDQRKTYEEAEANAIGTEYVRADLLPETEAAQLRTLLRSYLEQRILFYQARRSQSLDGINATTARLQADLWSVTKRNAVAQPTAISALTVAGMNDVLNSQGYSQAAWLNRIPAAAWCLMVAIAILCNVLVGFDVASIRARLLPLVLPLAISIAFFLIADIESPRGGFIHVAPQNLLSLAQSLRAQ